MDFINLYEKKIQKREQKEDYLTELIAFLCRISDKFKKFYINKFLELNCKDMNLVKIETQVRSSDENINNIPDLVILESNKIICICEHKIDSDINCKNKNKNITQLDDYYAKYGKGCKYILIKSEFKFLKNFRSKHNEIWTIKSWQKLFMLLKNNFNSNIFSDYFKYDSFEEFQEKNKYIQVDTKLVYFLMELLDEFELYNFDIKDIKSENSNINLFLQKTIESVDRFYTYASFLKEITGKASSKVTEIKDFIENNRVSIKVNNDYDRYGFYGWADSFYLLKWKNSKFFPFKLNDKIVQDTIKKLKNKNLDFSSVKIFNKQYDQTQENLDKFNMFFYYIIIQVKYELEKINIILERSNICSDNSLKNVYFNSKINNVYIHFEISKNSFLLYFDNMELSNKLKNITFKHKRFEEDSDWNYFELNANNLKFNSEDINKIINFYFERIKNLSKI
jgi:hypothetical protein